MVRVFVCTTLIHIRLAKMKFELLTTPFVDQFDEAIDSRKHLQDEVHRMTAFVQPAIEAVENPNPGFVPDNTTVPETQPMDPGNVTDAEYVDRYRGKLQSQCLFQIEETQRVCYRNYSYLYLDCVERVVLVQSFCDALKVEKYCSVSKVGVLFSFCNFLLSVRLFCRLFLGQRQNRFAIPPTSCQLRWAALTGPWSRIGTTSRRRGVLARSVTTSPICQLCRGSSE